MEEIGRVYEYGEGCDVVRVEIEGKGACQNCASRNVCVPFGGTNRMVTEAMNEKGARPGDLVRIEMRPKSTVMAAFLLYLLPVVALFIGYALGASATGEEKYGIGAGLFLLVFSFGVLKALNAFFSKGKRFKPVVVEIIRRGGADGSRKRS
ncbi:MAG: SoxR reducing system RseC family protein [Gemmatimonadota bacterium]|nr:MAG: SoxR reducing system RseC family protein [Gemmatimonadota bacterium]